MTKTKSQLLHGNSVEVASSKENQGTSQIMTKPNFKQQQDFINRLVNEKLH